MERAKYPWTAKTFSEGREGLPKQTERPYLAESQDRKKTALVLLHGATLAEDPGFTRPLRRGREGISLQAHKVTSERSRMKLELGEESKGNLPFSLAMYIFISLIFESHVNTPWGFTQ